MLPTNRFIPTFDVKSSFSPFAIFPITTGDITTDTGTAKTIAYLRNLSVVRRYRKTAATKRTTFPRRRSDNPAERPAKRKHQQESFLNPTKRKNSVARFVRLNKASGKRREE